MANIGGALSVVTSTMSNMTGLGGGARASTPDKALPRLEGSGRANQSNIAKASPMTQQATINKRRASVQDYEGQLRGLQETIQAVDDPAASPSEKKALKVRACLGQFPSSPLRASDPPTPRVAAC